MPQSNITCRLVDLSGRTIKALNIDALTHQIDLSSLPAASYFLQFDDSFRWRKSVKIIKQ